MYIHVTYVTTKQEVFFPFFMYFIQHYFICRPSDSSLSEDAGIEPRTVATLALAVRWSNHKARTRLLYMWTSLDNQRQSRLQCKFVPGQCQCHTYLKIHVGQNRSWKIRIFLKDSSMFPTNIYTFHSWYSFILKIYHSE
jgi:hypothetical protein